MMTSEIIPGVYATRTSLDCHTADPALTVAEQFELMQVKSPVRRRAYCSARSAAKSLLNSLTGSELSQLEILSRDEQGKPTRPRVCVAGGRSDWQLSFSHKGEHVLIVATSQPDIRLGCDLEFEAALSPGFRQLWLTSDERAWLETHKDFTATQIWASKEATFKATNDGHKFLPRRFHVHPAVSAPWRCEATDSGVTAECRPYSDLSDTVVAVIAIASFSKGISA